MIWRCRNVRRLLNEVSCRKTNSLMKQLLVFKNLQAIINSVWPQLKRQQFNVVKFFDHVFKQETNALLLSAGQDGKVLVHQPRWRAYWSDMDCWWKWFPCWRCSFANTTTNPSRNSTIFRIFGIATSINWDSFIKSLDCFTLCKFNIFYFILPALPPITTKMSKNQRKLVFSS